MAQQTIRLLSTYDNNPPNTIITVDSSIAAGLLAGGVGATTDLTGGTYRLGSDITSALGRIPTRLTRPRPVSGWGGNLPMPPTFSAPGAGIRNYPLAFSAWAPFNAVQIVFLNHSLSPVTIDDHIVGASSTAWPGGVFNINDPESGWSAPAGPVIVPAATGSNKRPGVALGPRLQVRSIPRAPNEPDGGKYPLLFVRTKHNAGNSTMPMASLVANFPSLYDPVNEGFSILTADPYQDVDVTSVNPGTWNTSSARATANPAVVAFGAIFTYDAPITPIFFLGDSIMAGASDGASLRSSWGFRATARLRAAGKMVAHYDCGIQGSPIADITARGKDFIAQGRPFIVVMAPYTINGSQVATQALWDIQWANVMEAVAAVEAAGGIAVLTTPLANNSFSTTQNGFRVNQLRRVLSSGLPVINFESMADSNGKFAFAADHAGDGTHPAGGTPFFGHDKMANLALPTLNALIP